MTFFKILKRRFLRNLLDKHGRFRRALWNHISNSPTYFTQNPTKVGIEISDGTDFLSLAIQSRIDFFPNGINSRLASLIGQYCVGDLELSEAPNIIDIGSNIGEFALFHSKKYPKSRILCIEPDPICFEVLLANKRSNMIPKQCAIWNLSATLDFFLSSEEADSSLLQMDANARKIQVNALPLDDLVADFFAANETFDLIKIEAEGAEPEIIQGALKTLTRTKWVTIDVGPERGFAQENTLIPCLNQLMKIGFKPVQFNSKRYVLLFENSASDY